MSAMTKGEGIGHGGGRELELNTTRGLDAALSPKFWGFFIPKQEEFLKSKALNFDKDSLNVQLSLDIVSETISYTLGFRSSRP